MRNPYNWNDPACVAKATHRLTVYFIPGTPHHNMFPCGQRYYGKYRHKDGGVGDLRKNCFKNNESEIQAARLYKAPYGNSDLIEILKGKK